MTTSTSTNNLALGGKFNDIADYTIGTVLLICTVIGVPANLASCYYFLTSKARNTNAIFFNRVYSIISVVDCLICAIQFPVIDVFFNGRVGRLFENEYFCDGWVVVKSTLAQTSVFLVAVLSVSRLLVLIYPRKQLSPVAAWVAPAICCSFSVFGMCICPLILQCITTRYLKPLGTCILLGNAKGFELNLTTLNTVQDTILAGW